MTHSFDLMVHSHSKSDLPGPDAVYICVNHCSIDEKGNMLITPDCVILKDVEEQIVRLKRELDEIMKKAKKHFSRNTNNA